MGRQSLDQKVVAKGTFPYEIIWLNNVPLPNKTENRVLRNDESLQKMLHKHFFYDTLTKKFCYSLFALIQNLCIQVYLNAANSFAP